jgi:peptidoglycan/xylan/chitin deacetylase (PgdA/CDA1 family)
VSVGDRWEAFQLLDAEGQGVEWRPGRVTVVSFCAYWCDTWKSQVPKLVEVKGALRGLPVDIRTVSIDGRWAEVAKNNGGLPLWRDPGATWSRSVGVDRVPTTAVLDRQGRVAFVSTGVVRRDDLLHAARRALSGATGEAGAVYLTFDDFPPPAGGEALLDVLRAAGARATLFTLGSRVEAQAKLLRRAISEGHSVQCHSWDHDAATPQIDRCREVFRRVLGQDFGLYRAPGSEKIVGLASQPPVVDPYDYTRPGKDELLRRILTAVRPGSQIQLHAGVGETLEALPSLVKRLRDRGFTLEPL